MFFALCSVCFVFSMFCVFLCVFSVVGVLCVFNVLCSAVVFSVLCLATGECDSGVGRSVSDKEG